MASFKRALRTTWWIFDVTSHRTSIILRILLLLIPVLLGVGVTLSFLNFLSLIPSLAFGVVAFIVFLTLMLQTSPEQERIVEQYLSDESYIDKSIEYTPDVNLSQFIEDDVRPRFYQGAGAWIASGHIDPEKFLDVIRVFDPYVDSIADEELIPLVEHVHLVNTFAPRPRRDAVKIVDSDAPNSYPATILMPPYDNYVPQGGTFPDQGE